MDRSLRAALILLLGIALLAAALILYFILLETVVWIVVLTGLGGALTLWGGFSLREILSGLVRRRRGEIGLFTLGALGILVIVGLFSVRYTVRYDLTEAGLHSLSDQTVTMLERLERPVDITFFADHMMRESVELYELFAAQTDNVSVEFFDPTLNPAAARLKGVRFAGTAVLESGDQVLQLHGSTETDIANGILRVSQGAKQLVCFLEGHQEADPFSQESHDHMEAAPGTGHSHSTGTQFVLHETHGLAKARQGLEATNYSAAKVSLLQQSRPLDDCALLVVAGPKTPLLANEIAAIDAYLAAGGNAFFMLEPFIDTGLDPILKQYGVVLDNNVVIDETNHFWTDVSSPAVTDYFNHQVTRDLPLTFFPGVRSLSPTEKRMPGTSVWPLVNTSRNSFGETSTDRPSFDEGVDMPGPRTIMLFSIRRPLEPDSPSAIRLGPQDGQSATPALDDSGINDHVTAVSRIAVVGDSDFATNSFFHFLGNGNLFLNAVSYLTAQENLIGIEPNTYDLPRLSLTNRQVKWIFILAVALLPALLTVLGTATWLRQR